MNKQAAIRELAEAVQTGLIPAEALSSLIPLVQDDGKLQFGTYSLTVAEVLDIECSEAY